MATTEDYFTPRSRKAQRACHLCSATKVRCIAEAGSACHNCTRRGVECVTDQRIRRKLVVSHACNARVWLTSCRRRVHPKLPGLVPKTPNQDWPPGSIAGNTYPLIATPQSLPTQDGFIISAGIPRFEWKNAPTGPNSEAQRHDIITERRSSDMIR